MAILAASALLLPQGVSSAAGPTATFFPSGDNIGTTAYTARFAGANRFNTAGTAVIADMSVAGHHINNYPFVSNNVDHNGPAVFGGLGCDFRSGVRAIGIAAGDTPADALTASQSAHLTRTYPKVGGGTGSARVEDLLLTASTRQGATDLSSETIAAIQRIRAVCGTFNVVVFGGSAAVPNGALTTAGLVAGGTVFQLSGADRFDTAKLTAFVVSNTSAVGIHKTSTASTQSSLPKTAFLAEGYTGADALSIGPYTAHNNNTLLLTATNSLPGPTASALTGFAPSNIIVLGGSAAISDAVASAAASAAGGATITRIFGAVRYDTSVAIAEELDNLWPQNAVGSGGATYSDQSFVFARSEGSGADHVGWPDALASAIWTDGYDNGNDVAREAPPVEKNFSSQSLGQQAFSFTHTDATDTCTNPTDAGGEHCETDPLLLTTGASLAPSISTYLGGLYPDPTEMITATNPAAGSTVDNDGGFGVIWGGTAAVSAGAEATIANLLSGGTYTASGASNFVASPTNSDQKPTADAAGLFYTNIALSGAYSTASNGGVDGGGATSAGDKVCQTRNALVGTEYLALYDNTGTTTQGNLSNSEGTVYEPTGTGEAFTPFQSRIQCSSASVKKVNAIGESLSGNETAPTALDFSAAGNKVETVTGPSGNTASSFSGDPTFDDTPDSTTGDTGSTPAQQVFTSTNGTLVQGATTTNGLTWTLTVNYSRADGPGSLHNDNITWAGTLVLQSGTTTVQTLNLKGEVAAAEQTGPAIALVGEYTVGSANGGIHLTVTRAGPAGAPTGFTLSDFALQGLS